MDAPDLTAPRRHHRALLTLVGIVWAAALMVVLGAGATAGATTRSHPHLTRATSGTAPAPGRRRRSSGPRRVRRHRRTSGIHGARRHRPHMHRRRATPRLARAQRARAARRFGHRPADRIASAAASSRTPLVFGIYPGGAAGTTGPNGPVAPEDPGKRLAALQQLRPPGVPFVLHIYAGYTGPGSWTAAQQVGNAIAQYTAAGFEVELVLTYRPADGGSPQDVSGFVDFVRQTVMAFGPNHGFVSLQVTNEANVTGAPNASDGAYAGAEDALIRGVIAARAAIRAGGFNQVRVGFNWAAAGNVDERAFWSYLGRQGGAAFVQALDWVGLDIYPGTWGPPLSRSLSSGTTAAFRSALTDLRNVYLPLAGIPFRVPLHVSESGYPTGPGRTPAMQVQAMNAAVDTVIADQSTFNITDYRWFDLRDADSTSGDFQSQYGLMTDAYAPKPAFFTYQALVARFGARA